MQDIMQNALLNRRAMLALTGAAAILPLSGFRALAQSGAPMKLATIGAGNIGGTIGSLWVKAGHEVFFSSLNPDELKPMVEKLGSRARAGHTAQAVAFGDVALLAVPYRAIPDVARDHGPALRGKILIDACNAVARRDGEELLALTRQKGIGLATAGFFPGVRVVRGFNSIGARVFVAEAHRAGDRLPIPLASDDAAAAQVAEQLVRDAGYEPVMAGGLARAADFAMGTPAYGAHPNAAALRKLLGV